MCCKSSCDCVVALLLDCLANCSFVLQTMIDPDPNKRPSPSTLLTHPTLCPNALKSKVYIMWLCLSVSILNELLLLIEII